MPARKTTGAAADGKGVWFWHPWLVSSRRRFSGPNRASESRQFAGDGGKREIRLQGERAISRKTIAQGRPGVPAHLAVTRVHFVRTIAGAEGTRLSLRPLRFRGHRYRITSGASRRENAKVCLLRRHTPRRQGIQYAASSRLKAQTWNTGSPAFAGDDSELAV